MNRLIGIILLVLSTSTLADGRLGTVLDTPMPIGASTALVVNADTSDVVYKKNIQAVRSIASITKLMTAMVTLDANLPMDEEITITKDDVNATKLHGRPTSKTLAVGTSLSRKELLHLALMNSQNRAAAALARTYPGGIDAFVDAMNEKAISLGMTNTSFADPTGLISLNKSTACDLAKMVNAAVNYPVIREFSTSTSYTITPNTDEQYKTEFRTTDRLLIKNNWNINIQKTGYTRSAGRCLVMMATINDQRFILVLLNTSDTRSRANDAISLMYWLQTGNVASKSTLKTLNPYPVCRHHKHHHKHHRHHHHVAKRR